jgi:hypothetical protein
MTELMVDMIKKRNEAQKKITQIGAQVRFVRQCWDYVLLLNADTENLSRALENAFINKGEHLKEFARLLVGCGT